MCCTFAASFGEVCILKLSSKMLYLYYIRSRNYDISSVATLKYRQMLPQKCYCRSLSQTWQISAVLKKFLLSVVFRLSTMHGRSTSCLKTTQKDIANFDCPSMHKSIRLQHSPSAPNFIKIFYFLSLTSVTKDDAQQHINHSINQPIKTHLYSAICHERMRGTEWQRLG